MVYKCICTGCGKTVDRVHNRKNASCIDCKMERMRKNALNKKKAYGHQPETTHKP